QVVLQNKLFQTEALSLALILYQDSFEVVNPLGSGKKKHKVLAVYLTLGDIQPYYRSNIDHMQLVLLCREQDFKYFGQVVFSRLMADLKELEDSGIVLKDGRILRGEYLLDYYPLPEYKVFDLSIIILHHSFPSFTEDVSAAILAVLPNLQEQTLSSLLEKLASTGVECKSDLRLVKEEDLQEYLRPIQCRKLLQAWSIEGKMGQTDQTGSNTPSSIVFSQLIPTDRCRVIDLSTWLDKFKVPWSKMPQGIKLSINAQHRPLLCAVVPLPILVPSFRNDGTRIGSGFASLLNQLKTRVEHLKRNIVIGRRRRMKGHSSSPATNRAKGPSDQYGCIRWQPDCPQGEIESILKEKQEEMKELYAREGPAAAERGHLTHPAPSIVELKTGWPFLFTQKEIYNHFKLLTDISILEKITDAIEHRGKMIINFFRQKPTNEVQQILSRFDSNRATILAPCVVLLLMAHFKEHSEALILQATATPADVEESVLPDSPRLIVSETLTSANWMMSIEGQVVLSSQPNFAAGLAALFASFYNFNLEYQKEASCTLEFIQRCFVGINPTTGSKTSTEQVLSKRSAKVVEKKKHSMNVKVCSLLRKLIDFDWLCMSV
uniref:Uncharacterized protein n=1 Tax=Astyanax mexicanus TaxID=7994 RepID=A0A3B1JNM8_ASTMX